MAIVAADDVSGAAEWWRPGTDRFAGSDLEPERLYRGFVLEHALGEAVEVATAPVHERRTAAPSTRAGSGGASSVLGDAVRSQDVICCLGNPGSRGHDTIPVTRAAWMPVGCDARNDNRETTCNSWPAVFRARIP
jgi:hypothetical protein